MERTHSGRFWLILIPGVTLVVMLGTVLLSPSGCGGSTPAMLQSPRPIDDKEKRPSSGGVIRARATVSPRPRSGPYHGLERPAGLRVVATMTAGCVEISEASKRGPVAAMLAQPASAAADPAATRPRNAARRDTAWGDGKRSSGVRSAMR